MECYSPSIKKIKGMLIFSTFHLKRVRTKVSLVVCVLLLHKQLDGNLCVWSAKYSKHSSLSSAGVLDLGIEAIAT